MFDINHPLNNLGDHWSLINIVDLQKQPWRSLLCCGCPQVHTALSFSYFVLSFFVAIWGVAYVRTIFSSVYKHLCLHLCLNPFVSLTFAALFVIHILHLHYISFSFFIWVGVNIRERKFRQSLDVFFASCFSIENNLRLKPSKKSMESWFHLRQ